MRKGVKATNLTLMPRDLNDDLFFLYKYWRWNRQENISVRLNLDILYNILYKSYMELIHSFICKWSKINESTFTTDRYLLFEQDIKKLDAHASTFCEVCDILKISNLEYSENGIKESDINKIFMLTQKYSSTMIREKIRMFNRRVNELKSNPSITKDDLSRLVQLHTTNPTLDLKYFGGFMIFPSIPLNKSKGISMYLYFYINESDKISSNIPKEYSDICKYVNYISTTVIPYMESCSDSKYFNIERGCFLSSPNDFLQIPVIRLSLASICMEVINEIKRDYHYTGKDKIEFNDDVYTKFILVEVRKYCPYIGSTCYPNNRIIYNQIKTVIEKFYLKKYKLTISSYLLFIN